MNNKNILLFLVAFSLFFSCSQHADIPVWEISKGDGPKSYLVGTIDYMNKSEDGDLLNELITKKFEAATTYISQIDVQNSDFLLTKQELEIGMNQTLKEAMKTADYEYLHNLVSEFNQTKGSNFPPPDSNRTKLLFYLQDLLYNDNQNNFFFEQYFMKQAMASGKNLVGLETYQDYYRTQSQVAEEEQVSFMRTIKSIHSFSDTYKKSISKAYRDGNLEEVHKINLSTFPYFEKNYANFFTKKHSFWAKSIENELDKQKCFITIDASHLAGEGNFIEILLSKGYKINKIQ